VNPHQILFLLAGLREQIHPAFQEEFEPSKQSIVSRPGHCANIMSADYTEFGAGIDRDTSGTRYWTLVLAAPGREPTE